MASASMNCRGVISLRNSDFASRVTSNRSQTSWAVAAGTLISGPMPIEFYTARLIDLDHRQADDGDAVGPERDGTQAAAYRELDLGQALDGYRHGAAVDCDARGSHFHFLVHAVNQPALDRDVLDLADLDFHSLRGSRSSFRKGRRSGCNANTRQSANIDISSHLEDIAREKRDGAWIGRGGWKRRAAHEFNLIGRNRVASVEETGFVLLIIPTAGSATEIVVVLSHQRSFQNLPRGRPMRPMLLRCPGLHVRSCRQNCLQRLQEAEARRAVLRRRSQG